jgi:hypothetical protein
MTRRDFLQSAGILSVCGTDWEILFSPEPPSSHPTSTAPRFTEDENLNKQASNLQLRGRQFERAGELLAQVATENPGALY